MEEMLDFTFSFFFFSAAVILEITEEDSLVGQIFLKQSLPKRTKQRPWPPSF
jgi:hypothetical protein